MINELIKYQQWRTGQIDASLDEISLTPAKVTACLNWAIESLTNGLDAHDAEVAAKAVEDFCKSSDGLAIEKCPQESDGCSEDLITGWKAGNVDCRMAGFKYAAKLRAKAAK